MSSELLDELVEEILLRLPPDEPACLIRAALVCKAWRRILSAYGFRRRYYRFHRAPPPLLGYIRHLNVDSMPEFVAASGAVFAPAAAATVPTGSAAGVHAYGIDCRHGRVLIHDESSPAEPRLVVWDPITGGQEPLSMPPAFRTSCPFSAAAVLCARHLRGCDHLDCHVGPFLVVFVGERDGAGDAAYNWAAVYSSETRAWSAAETSDNNDYYGSPCVSRPSLLIGDALHFTLFTGGAALRVLRCDIASGGSVHGRRLSVIDDTPLVFKGNNVVPIEIGGGLGFVEYSFRNRIYTWSRRQADASNGVGGGWVRDDDVVDLETSILTRRHAPYHHNPDDKIRFAEGTNTVLISMNNRMGFGVFALDLKSRHVREIADKWDTAGVLPYMSFYTPAE
ncbi:hypothetical protein BS78_04G307200 [Paspalum vaginatum]|nr:hypothetical protein BS78_04G307200 [Paspalum vaginatum]